MNTNFNFTRFGLLLKRYFLENKKSDLMLFGIYAIVLFFVQSIMSFYLLFFVGGAFYAAKQFKAFETVPGGIQYLSLPATQTEKLTLAVAMSSVYYPLMLICAYIISNTLGYAISEAHVLPELININLFNSSFSLFGSEGDPVGAFFETSHKYYLSMFLFLTGQSIFMLGALYFNKNAVLKTTLVQFIIGFIFIVSLSIITKSYYEGVPNHIGSFENTSLDSRLVFDTFINFFIIILKFFIIATAPFFWLISYFRLTEKQV